MRHTILKGRAVAGAAAVWGRLDKQTLENCMNVIAIALAVVMAGTGDLQTCKLLRGGSPAATSDELT